MTTRYIIPERDVIATLPNGNQVIVAHAGQPIPIAKAAAYGLVAAPVGPSEIKEPAPQTAPAAPLRKR